jgi:hypothetical protein
VTDAWAAPAATGGTGLSRINTVTVANVDVYTVTLTWTASASADRYKVFFTPDSINYYLAPLPAGASMLTRSACVSAPPVVHRHQPQVCQVYPATDRDGRRLKRPPPPPTS